MPLFFLHFNRVMCMLSLKPSLGKSMLFDERMQRMGHKRAIRWSVVIINADSIGITLDYITL